ncbi:MAG: YihY/virulence factor BrkB family protein [Thermoanaerobaculia bacterium]
MKKYLQLFKETVKEFGEDKAPRLGAALAYYTIFSIAPLLLIAIAIAGMVFGDEAARGGITRELGKVMGVQTANVVEEMVANAGKPKAGIAATIIGVIMLLFGASGVFGQLKDALNTIWNVEAKKAGGIMGFVRQRFLSMTMVMGVAFLLLVSLVLDAALSGMNDYLDRMVPGGALLVQAIQIVISFGVVTVAFAVIFRHLPDLRVAWHDVWLGAAFTAFLFVLGKFGLGMYIARAAPGSSLGAAGALVILLIWVYWSAQILFFGAEYTQVYARRHGSMKGDRSKIEARQRGQRVDPPKSAPALQLKSEGRRGGGGKAKLAVGGLAGLVIGALIGGITAGIVAVKLVKKLLTLPFK